MDLQTSLTKNSAGVDFQFDGRPVSSMRDIMSELSVWDFLVFGCLVVLEGSSYYLVPCRFVQPGSAVALTVSVFLRGDCSLRQWSA